MENLQLILKAIDKAKGMDTIVYDFRKSSFFVDYVILTSASNSRQLNAIADYVREAMLMNQMPYSHIEGNDSSKWLLVDGKNIIVHIFEEHEREIYGLEKLYSGMERVKIDGHVSETGSVL